MQITNTAKGPRGVHTKSGETVYLEPGESRDLDVDGRRRLYEGLVGGEEAEEALRPLDDHTVAELREIAEAEEIDLGDATKKADIIAAIELAREG